MPQMNNARVPLIRRGFDLGSINLASLNEQSHADTKPLEDSSRWQHGQPTLIQGICAEALNQHQTDLRQAEKLYIAILDEHECDGMLAQEPYAERLAAKFESLGCSVNAGDDQEIETVLFDALANEKIVAEDLWMKVAWLSFHEEDASLRFRFSFGVEHEEDVAADQSRQHYAAELTDAIFPESRVITQNQNLHTRLKALLNSASVRFVERIVYFNSPNGGAYLHHDRERGHAGVVYAQLSGATFWLALPKHRLVTEITEFIQSSNVSGQWPSTLTSEMQQELIAISPQPKAIADQLDTFANSALVHLINETQDFVQQLIDHGHGHVVEAGDALLLPQEAEDTCCWHSVFNLGDESGQALSFAITVA